MTTTRLCFVRHGETDWNAAQRLQGQLDIPLNRNGEEQAERLGRALAMARLRFDALYVSDLTRTQQTARPVSALLGLEPRLAPALRERHFGHFQGLTYAEASERMPDAYQAFRARHPAYEPEGGESLQALQGRIHAFLDRILAEHRGQTLLLISHGGVLDMVYRLATGKPLGEARDFPIPNAALNWLRHDAEGWRVEHWADERHLASALDEL